MQYFKISHLNGSRGADELVVYTKSGTTGTNAYGIEAIVIDAIVESIGSNNNTVPVDGFVLSGHGKGAEIISKQMCEGARIVFEADKMRVGVDIDDEARLYGARKALDEIKKRFEALVSAEVDFDLATAFNLIQKAEQNIENNEADKAMDTLEEAYYVTSFSRSDEIRAIWHRPLEKSPSEVDATVARMKNAGFNLMLIETNYEGWANAAKCVYPYLPLRPELENRDFDLIEEFIKAGKKYGVKMHAWLEDFFIGVDGSGCKMLELRPDLIARTKDGGVLVDGWDCFIFLNPALDEVHELLENMYRDLLDNYDFDGIQLDYIRYPVIKDINHSAGFEKQTKAAFKADTGININRIKSTDGADWKRFTEWRAERVTAYVKRIVNMVDEYKQKGRKIVLSTAVFGNPDEAIRLKCQNWQYWVNQKWLDLIFPMAYLNDADDVRREIEYMVKNYGEAPNVSGISPMYGKLPVIESTKQVEACRAAGAAGVAFFETKSLTDLQIEKLREGVFRYDTTEQNTI